MERATLLIGVSSTGGNMPTLHAVESGIDAVATWAQTQGIAVTRLTDAAEPVTTSQVKSAVKGLCRARSVEQFIIYFAGHGINRGYNEYWLLSGAPEDTQEAVNVAGSVELARHCGIRHVVLISDACRTSAEGIQAQGVTGSEIFPNPVADGPEQAVDIFFASTLGRPALEVKDPQEAAARYQAVYTDALVFALRGDQPDLAEAAPDQPYRFIRPRPLKNYLRTAVGQRLDAANAPLTVFQEPDARITSDDDAYLSRLSTMAQPQATPPPAPAAPPQAPAPTPPVPLPPSQATRSPETPAPTTSAPPGESSAGHEASLPAEESSGTEPGGPERPAREEPLGQVPRYLQNLLRGCLGISTRQLRLPADVDDPVRGRAPVPMTADEQADAGSVVRVVGAQIVEAEPVHGRLTLSPSRLLLSNTEPAAEVFVRFDDGTAALLPAIDGWTTEITVDDGELDDVWFNPFPDVDPSTQPRAAAEEDARLRRLRAVTAANARMGVLEFEADEAHEMVAQMQTARGHDPTLALYAAYALSDLRDVARIKTMDVALRSRLGGVRLFDVAMLAGDLDGRDIAEVDDVYPSVPLLSKGWATLRARRITLPAGYDVMEAHLRPSLWTLFDSTGADRALDAIRSQKGDT